jgi:hypothetical protein
MSFDKSRPSAKYIIVRIVSGNGRLVGYVGYSGGKSLMVYDSVDHAIKMNSNCFPEWKAVPVPKVICKLLRSQVPCPDGFMIDGTIL